MSKKADYEKYYRKALELLEKKPQGYTIQRLAELIHEDFPDKLLKTILKELYDLDAFCNYQDEVYYIKKGKKGIYRHKKHEDINLTTEPESHFPEDSFYNSFAKYLIEELGECTNAIPFGGNKFSEKWSTPDVIGVNSTSTSLEETEIIITSTEIKNDTSRLIEAFGQACAYKIFSHKVYLTIPKKSENIDKKRIESLCSILGIGLVFFDIMNNKNPEFEMRIKAKNNKPDVEYITKYKVMNDEFKQLLNSI